MNKLELHFIKKILKKTVVQGAHRDRIIAFYRLLIEAARAEFTEDNKPTLDGFLEECHQEALKDPDLPMKITSDVFHKHMSRRLSLSQAHASQDCLIFKVLELDDGTPAYICHRKSERFDEKPYTVLKHPIYGRDWYCVGIV